MVGVSEVDTTRSAPHLPYREMEESHELSHIAHPDHDELLTLNIGPHHPATHGVLRLLTTLEGEVVRDIKPIIGYLHTGIEKTAEDKSYWKVIPVIERMDYLAYYFNAMAFCGAVETLLDIEVPPRAQYLRVIHLELNRIMSHMVWLGTSALDLGAMSMFWYCFRDREQILDLFEMSSGQRMHTRYFQVGGVFEDIPSGFMAKVKEFTDVMPTRVDQFTDLLDKNEIFLQRLRNVAAVDEETLLGLGVTGPLLRATGNPWDLRKAAPYSSYDHFEFKIPVGTIGDNYDRYRCRVAEIKESVRIIEQAAEGLPEGALHHGEPQVRAAAAPRAGDLDGGADPPLQARDRGLPRAAGRGLLPDRVAARRARLLHPRRRLLQAGTCPHARPLVRQSAGAQADGPGPLHRRPDRHAGDARPGPGRDRPLMAIDPSQVRRFEHGSRVPGWDDAVDLTKDPAVVPDPATTPVPKQLRAQIEAHMAKYPDPRSASIPALHAVQDWHGWCSPTAIEQAACVMRLTPAYLTAVATFYDMFDTVPTGEHTVYVCTNISCSLRGADEVYAAMLEAAGGDPRFNVRGFECLGACDIAPMASVNGEYVGPLTTDDCKTIVGELLEGREVLPDKQLRKRPLADTLPLEEQG